MEFPIDTQEIKSLINEVGESIYLIDKDIKEPPNFELGIPNQYQYHQKLKVLGYTTTDKKTLFINEGFKTTEGNLILYLLEDKKGLVYSKLNKGNTICFIRGVGYSFILNNIIYSRSKPILYRLTIEPTQTTYQADSQNQEYIEEELSSKESIENAFDF